MMRWMVAVLVAVVSVGCGTAARPVPSASVDTAIRGWDRWFDLAWRVEPKGERRDLYVHVYNDSGRSAVNVRLLAQAFDASGALLDQKLERLTAMVPARDGTYVRIANLPPADKYRVTVWTFDFLEIPAWRRR